MNTVKPITPEEVEEANLPVLRDELLFAVNELLLKMGKYGGHLYRRQLDEVEGGPPDDQEWSGIAFVYAHAGWKVSGAFEDKLWRFERKGPSW